MDVSLPISDKSVCAFCENSWLLPLGYTRPDAIKLLEGVAKDHFVRRIILQDGNASLDESSSGLSQQGSSTNILRSIILCDDCVCQFVIAEEKILKAQSTYLSKMTGKKDFTEILADPWLDVKRVAYAKLKSQEDEITEKLRLIAETKPAIMAPGNQEHMATTVLAVNSTSTSTTEIRSIESLSHVHESQVVFTTSMNCLPVTLPSNVQVEFVNSDQSHQSTSSAVMVAPHQSTSAAAMASQEPALNQQSRATSIESAASTSESDSDSKLIVKPDATKNGTSTLATLRKSMNFNAVVFLERLKLPLSSSIISQECDKPSSSATLNGKKKKAIKEVFTDSDDNDDDDENDVSKSIEKKDTTKPDQVLTKTNEANSDGIDRNHADEAENDAESAMQVENTSNQSEQDAVEDEDLFVTPRSSDGQVSLTGTSEKNVKATSVDSSNASSKASNKDTDTIKSKKTVANKKKQSTEANTQLSRPTKKDDVKSSVNVIEAAAKKLSTSTPEQNPMNKAKSGAKRLLTSTPIDESTKKMTQAKRLKPTTDESSTKTKSGTAEAPKDSPLKSKSAGGGNSSNQIEKLMAFSKSNKSQSSSPIVKTPLKKKGRMIGHRMVSDSSDSNDSSSSDDSDDDIRKRPVKKN
ncbi:unnamed protein product [Orchesella dallaii]|uniref:Uncharacterized protein n=1 Tax=Orchesella dallaii TaxID=48710 RepID=A0ABP1Q6J3_9HEXA